MNTNTPTAFVDVLPCATLKDDKNPLDFIDVNVVIAVREHTNRVTKGHVDTNIKFQAAVRALAPKAFEHYSDPSTTTAYVPLSKFGEKSQFMCKQTQLFRPALNTPVVHPSHVYIASVALTVRRVVLQNQVTVATQRLLTADNIASAVESYRSSAIAADIEDSGIARQLAALDNVGEQATLTASTLNLRAFHADVLTRHRREMASLPAHIVDADAWLADWFDACTPAFPDSASWLTKALMWRDMGCKTR